MMMMIFIHSEIQSDALHKDYILPTWRTYFWLCLDRHWFLFIRACLYILALLFYFRVSYCSLSALRSVCLYELFGVLD